MAVLFVEYPKCSTCRKAKKWLEEHDVKFEDRDIVAETPRPASSPTGAPDPACRPAASSTHPA